MRSGLALLLALVAVSTASADTILVPEDHASVTAAIAAALEGDEIVVGAGVFAPSTTGETYPLLLTETITLRGSGIGVTVLDAESTGQVIRVTGGSPVVRDFTLTGGRANRGGGVQIEGGSPEIAHNLVWQNEALKRGSGINTQGTSTAWIHHNVVWENTDEDFIEGGDPHGIQSGESSAPLVEHNLVGMTDSNGLLAGEASTPTIRHNIIAWNGLPDVRGRGICNFGAPGTHIHHNLFFANEISAMVMFDDQGELQNLNAVDSDALYDDDLVYGNLDGDPLLENPATMDFMLTEGSPAIDAGDPALGTDPDGTPLDLGPYAFTQATSAPSTASFALVGARPNPFNPRTQIVFELQNAQSVELRIVDPRGRAVRTLSTDSYAAGRHAVRWNGRNDTGQDVASGVYLAVLRTNEGSESRPLVLVR